MTICIASVAGDGCVVVVSDRMATLSIPSTEFEQNRPKTVQIADNCMVASAGNALGLDPIHETAAKEIGGDGSGMTVADMAETVRKAYVRARNEKMDQMIFSRIGLEIRDFREKSASLAPSVVVDLTEAMSAYDYNLSIIVAGADNSGGHIYRIDNPGRMERYDSIGHCAIGSGSLHAVSAFIASDYDHELDASRVMAMSYEAKRRSEKAQGVGKETDMYVVRASGISKIADDKVRKMDEIYGRWAAQEAESINVLEEAARRLGMQGTGASAG